MFRTYVIRVLSAIGMFYYNYHSIDVTEDFSPYALYSDIYGYDTYIPSRR